MLVSGQGQGHGQARQELVEHRRARDRRSAQIEAHQPQEELAVLDEERPVEAELLTEPGHGFLGGVQPGDRLRRIAGQEPHHREHDHGDQPQRGQRDEDAPPEVPDHRSSHAFWSSTRSLGVISTPFNRLWAPTMKCWE